MGAKNFLPRSKFEAWVRENGGTRRISIRLDVAQSSVQHWLAGRATPNLKTTNKILRLAQGKLTLLDVVNGTARQ